MVEEVVNTFTVSWDLRWWVANGKSIDVWGDHGYKMQNLTSDDTLSPSIVKLVMTPANIPHAKSCGSNYIWHVMSLGVENGCQSFPTQAWFTVFRVGIVHAGAMQLGHWFSALFLSAATGLLWRSLTILGVIVCRPDHASTQAFWTVLGTAGAFRWIKTRKKLPILLAGDYSEMDPEPHL